MNDDMKQALRRKGSFLRTMRAVGWSFFGVRKASGLEQDVRELNPLHVVIAGVLAAFLFVLLLLVVVSWVVGSGGAAR